MPIHDWRRVEAAISHDFHHSWVSSVSANLNSGTLPPGYYSLAEQQVGGFGPDFPTLAAIDKMGVEDLARRKISTIAIRHENNDAVRAIVELITPESKGSRRAIKCLTERAAEFLRRGIHLLVVDLLQPAASDPHGLHAALWEAIAEETFSPPADKRLAAAAYEAAGTVTAYVEPLAVRDTIPDMPLFLEPGAYVLVPLEKTYHEAFEAVPPRWRQVLES